MAAAAPPPALQAANQNRPPGPPKGRIADNIAHFARVLRDTGVPVGPGQVLDALDAATMGGLGEKQDFYWTLHAVFVKRREHKALFDQAFHVFWRRPKMIEQMMQLLFQQVRVEGHPRKKEAGQRRLASAMFAERDSQQSRRESPGEIEIEGEYSASADEVLRGRDFEQMTAEEEAKARAAIRRMRLIRHEVKTRRFEASSRGPADLRRTIRQSLRSGGAMIDLQHKRPRTHEPPLVVLTDISGSCTTYSRMFLHFLHALKTDRDRVSVFVFGTRLTNITRELDRRDVDEALEKVAGTVKDWSGGTRIGRTLKEFGGGNGEGLVRRHPHRPHAEGVQLEMVAPGSVPGRACAHHVGRARTRGLRGAGARDGAAQTLRPAGGLAQPAVALQGVCGERGRHPRHAAACRRVPPGAQSRQS